MLHERELLAGGFVEDHGIAVGLVERASVGNLQPHHGRIVVVAEERVVFHAPVSTATAEAHQVITRRVHRLIGEAYTLNAADGAEPVLHGCAALHGLGRAVGHDEPVAVIAVVGRVDVAALHEHDADEQHQDEGYDELHGHERGAQHLAARRQAERSFQHEGGRERRDVVAGIQSCQQSHEHAHAKQSGKQSGVAAKTEGGLHQLLHAHVCRDRDEEQRQQERQQAYHDRLRKQSAAQLCGSGTEHLLRVDAAQPHGCLCKEEVHEVDGGDEHDEQREAEKHVDRGVGNRLLACARHEVLVVERCQLHVHVVER